MLRTTVFPFTLMIALCWARDARAASFTPLPFPPNAKSSRALGISPDGGYVVGSVTYQNETTEAVRWNLADGTVTPLGWLPGGGTFSEARGVSTNGTTVVGVSDGELAFDPKFPQHFERYAFMWEGGTSRPPELFPPFGIVRSEAVAVSRDGATALVNGEFDQGKTRQSFFWRKDDPGLARIQGVDQASALAGTNSQMVVGDGWYRSDGSASDYIGDYSFSEKALYSLTPQQTTAVGYIGSTAARWHGRSVIDCDNFFPGCSANTVYLGQLAANDSTKAYAVADNGLTIVGESQSSSGSRAFLWQWDQTEDGRMRDLQTVLNTDYGIQATNWRLERARAISASGHQIAGYGSNPQGNEQAYVVDLTPANVSTLSLTNVAGGYWNIFANTLSLDLRNSGCPIHCPDQLAATPWMHFTEPVGMVRFRVSAPNYDPEGFAGQDLDYWAVDLCDESQDAADRNHCTQVYESRNDTVTTAFPFPEPFQVAIPLSTAQIVKKKPYRIRFRGGDGDLELTLGPLSISAISLEGGAFLTPGDADFDGAVTRADLAVFAVNLGRTSGATWADGDFNHDGRVGLRDLMTLRSRISSVGASNPVPEPATLALVLVFALAGAWRWRAGGKMKRAGRTW